MKVLVVIPLVVLAIALRVWRYRRRRAGRDAAADPAAAPVAARPTRPWGGVLARRDPVALGDVGLVAIREISERVRGRIFQVGTGLVLVVVVAAVVIPTLHGKATVPTQTVGYVGTLPSQALKEIDRAGALAGDRVTVLKVRSLDAAKAQLRSGHLDVAVVGGGTELYLNEAATASSSPADPSFVEATAAYLGVLKAYDDAHLKGSQLGTILKARPLHVQLLVKSAATTPRALSVIGLVLLFFMLTQYCTWTLIGVMQEKSSRVVEVLLATVRPIQLLGGKVLGIGLVALAQAALVVGAALAAGAAVGSDALRGTGATLLAAELLWLLLGYAFYCWVYAAAGSTAERQDQVQTLALPLSIPVLIGYLFSITVASTGSPQPRVPRAGVRAAHRAVRHARPRRPARRRLVAVRRLGGHLSGGHDRGRDPRRAHLPPGDPALAEL